MDDEDGETGEAEDGGRGEATIRRRSGRVLPLLKSTLKLVLQTAHRTRLNSSLATDTETCPKTHKVIDAVSSELEGHKNHLDHLRHGSAEDKKRLKEIGSPAPGLGLAALEGALSCDIGGALRSEIEDYLKKADPPDENMDPEITRDDLAEEISFIRLENCFDTEKMKLTIGAPEWGGRKLLMRASRSKGTVTHHHGVAPAGWLEDESLRRLEAGAAPGGAAAPRRASGRPPRASCASPGRRRPRRAPASGGPARRWRAIGRRPGARPAPAGLMAPRRRRRQSCLRGRPAHSQRLLGHP
ncbi:unnamed protein product, partial [Prorocentrum cordatum]